MAGQGKLIQSLVTSNFWATGLGSPTPNKTLGSTSLSCSSMQLYVCLCGNTWHQGTPWSRPCSSCHPTSSSMQSQATTMLCHHKS